LFKASSTYLSFSKSGTFGHPAVRIRVKYDQGVQGVTIVYIS
jgi:hypothetical protein